MPNPTFQRSAETESLIRIIKSAGFDLVTYEQMNSELRRRGANRPDELQSAIHALGREGIHYVTIRTKGVRRVRDDDREGEIRADTLRIRRFARRKGQRLASASPEFLGSKEGQKGLALYALTAHVASESVQKAIADSSVTVEPNKSLSVSDVKRIFG